MGGQRSGNTLPKRTGYRRSSGQLGQDFEQTMRVIDEKTRQLDFYPETIVRLLQRLIERVEHEMDDGAQPRRRVVGPR